MRKLLSILIPLLALLWMSIDYKISSIVELRPQSLHQWRQTDCLSFTENYYSFDAKFLEPQVHNMSSVEGKAAGEFPILYFINAQLWKIFGKSELLSRLFGFLIAFMGFFALFKLGEALSGSSLIGSIAPLVLYSSALFPYYAFNFLPNIPALSLAFVSVWMFFLSQKKSRQLYFVLGLAFAILAGLLKASSLIAPLAALGTIFLFSIKSSKARLFSTIIAVIAIGASLYVWYAYAAQYNVNYASNSFIIGYVPIWEMSSAEIQEVVQGFNQNWRHHFYSERAYFLFFSLSILNFLLFIIRRKWIGFTFYMLCLTGAFLYVLLFFKNLGIHDYYLIELFMIPALLVISFFYLITKWDYPWLKVLTVLFLGVFIYTEAGHARSKLKERFNDYYNFHHLTYYKALESIETNLEANGIDHDDLVISIPDESPNITLYLLNRRGWSNYGRKNMDKASIEASITQGASYLIINDPKLIEADYLSAFTQELVFEKENVSVFKL